MRKTTTVREYMSDLPEEIDRRERLSAALARMTKLHLRHLPVMDGPKVYGLLSRHDALDAWVEHGARAGSLTVGEVCTRSPLTVSPLATIGEVAGQMVERGVTSVLVTDADMLVGIFTSVDALRILAER